MEVRRASKSCWMQSATEALIGRVGIVMQSPCVTLRVRGRDSTRAGAMYADIYFIKSCMCSGVVEWWSSGVVE